MDPVDKAVYWGHALQRKVLDAADSILNSLIVNEAGDFINRTTDLIFDLYKHKLPSSGGVIRPVVKQRTLRRNVERFVSEHRWLLALILGGSVSGLYYYYNSSRNRNLITIKDNKKYIRTDKRRRAKRLSNGARTNVVVVIGSPLEPLVRIIANDLEKRGFIVYITVINDKEIKYIESEDSEDIRAFKVNSANEDTLNVQIESFNKTLNSPVTPFHKATPHNLKLMGVLIIPDLFYPVGPVENIGLKSWSDCLNAKVLSPLVLFSNNFINIIRNNNAIHFDDNSFNISATKLILLTPNLISSINLPFHAPESVAIRSLHAIFESFAREVIADELLNLQVINLKVGALNIFNHANGKESVESYRTALNNQVLGWGDNMKSIYGANFKQICLLSSPSPRLRGANLRELNYKIFDLLYSDVNRKRKPFYKRDLRVCYVGRGARAYDIIGKYLPNWLISWLIGCNSISNIILGFFGF